MSTKDLIQQEIDKVEEARLPRTEQKKNRKRVRTIFENRKSEQMESEQMGTGPFRAFGELP